MAKKRWDESSVSRDESGRFISQSYGNLNFGSGRPAIPGRQGGQPGVNHRDNKPVNRRPAREYLPQNLFDPTDRRVSSRKSKKPRIA